MPRDASASAVARMWDASAVAANAERQDVRMFDEQQRVADPAGAAVLDQRALQRERLVRTGQPRPSGRRTLDAGACPVPHSAVRPAVRSSRPVRALLSAVRSASGSQFSSDFFTIDMNSSATAPSITRWS